MQIWANRGPKPAYGNYRMSIFPHRICVMAAGCLVFLAAAPRVANALVLDWDAVAASNGWADGSKNNSYDLTGDGVKDITVALTAQNAGVWTNDTTSGVMTPAINQTLTGGLSQNSLLLAADLHTNSNVTFHLSFTGIQPGAANVSFTIFDIDRTTNSDIIDNIYGIAPDGTHVAATITNLGSVVSLSGTLLSQTLTGNGGAADNSSDGNATISFGSTIIHDVFFTFSNTNGAPFYQDIGIGDISFTPVPEINPAATSAVSCVLAVGLTVLAHRRAKLKARRLPAAQS
jgi:hypothetical protein